MRTLGFEPMSILGGGGGPPPPPPSYRSFLKPPFRVTVRDSGPKRKKGWIPVNSGSWRYLSWFESGKRNKSPQMQVIYILRVRHWSGATSSPARKTCWPHRQVLRIGRHRFWSPWAMAVVEATAVSVCHPCAGAYAFQHPYEKTQPHSPLLLAATALVGRQYPWHLARIESHHGKNLTIPALSTRSPGRRGLLGDGAMQLRVEVGSGQVDHWPTLELIGAADASLVGVDASGRLQLPTCSPGVIHHSTGCGVHLLSIFTQAAVRPRDNFRITTARAGRTIIRAELMHRRPNDWPRLFQGALTFGFISIMEWPGFSRRSRSSIIRKRNSIMKRSISK